MLTLRSPSSTTTSLCTGIERMWRFIVDLCRAAKGEVLELGCGTGRILIPAAEAGCTITGLDQSGFMLDRCRAKLHAHPPEVQKRVTLVEADMTNFSLGRTFALVTVPFRPLQHLVSVEEHLSFLACVQRAPEPGGKLALDVFYPDLTGLASPVNPEEIEDTPEVTLADGRRMRRTYRLTAKHLAEQTNDVELIYYVRDPPAPRRGSSRHSRCAISSASSWSISWRGPGSGYRTFSATWTGRRSRTLRRR